MPNHNVTLTANWVYYRTISVDGGVARRNGTVVASAIRGDNITLVPNEPTGNQYFVEWEIISPPNLIITNNTFTMPNEPVSVIAIFDEIGDDLRRVTIEEGGYGGTVSTVAKAGDTVTLLAGTRTGHRFTGWTGEICLEPFGTLSAFSVTSPGALDFDIQAFSTDFPFISNHTSATDASFIMPNSNVIVTASWELELFRVVFELADGMLAHSDDAALRVQENIVSGTAASPLNRNPIRAGHVFRGWDRLLSLLDSVTDNLTFTAQWERIEDLKFEGNVTIAGVGSTGLTVAPNNIYNGTVFAYTEVTASVTGARPNDLVEVIVPVVFNVHVGNGNNDEVIINVPVFVRTNGLGNGTRTVTITPEQIATAFNGATGSDGFSALNSPTASMVNGFVLGNVTGGGQVTSRDATAMARWIQAIGDSAAQQELESINPLFVYAGDLTASNNNTIEPLDLTILARMLLGLDISHLV
jgi:hypothetical protein